MPSSKVFFIPFLALSEKYGNLLLPNSKAQEQIAARYQPLHFRPWAKMRLATHSADRSLPVSCRNDRSGSTPLTASHRAPKRLASSFSAKGTLRSTRGMENRLLQNSSLSGVAITGFHRFQVFARYSSRSLYDSSHPLELIALSGRLPRYLPVKEAASCPPPRSFGANSSRSSSSC